MPNTLLRQLMDGTLEEMEHTDDRREAVRIALDHLTEDRDYYSKLKGAGLMDTKDMSEMAVFKAGLSRVARCLKGVAKAALPEGTVRHRKDGDYRKVGGEWQRLPEGQDRAKQGGSEKLSPKVKEMLDAEARPRMGELRQQCHEFKREAGPDDRTTLQDFARLIVGEEEGLFHTEAKPSGGKKGLHPALDKVRANPDNPDEPDYDDLINAAEAMGVEVTEDNLDRLSDKWQSAKVKQPKGTSGLGLTDQQSMKISRAHKAGDAKAYAEALEAAAPGKARELQIKVEAGDRLGKFKGK